MTIANRSRLLPCLFVMLFYTHAFASPEGTEFDVLLDGLFGTGEEVRGNEGHLGSVIFDGLPDMVPNGVVPPEPALPGNDLVVTEMVLPDPGPSDGEVIAIWIEGADEFGEPGATLFNNTIDDVVLFNIEGLYWVDGMADTVEVLDLYLTFEVEADLPIDPLFLDISGAGTEDDPLFLMFELDPSDFIGATDLHVEFEVTHAALVPVPGALLLMSSALAALGIRRRFAV